MRVNIYAEEMTDRVEIIAKEIDGHRYTGLRLYLELPVAHNGVDDGACKQCYGETVSGEQGTALLHAAADECMSPDQRNLFDSLGAHDADVYERLFRCVAKRIDASAPTLCGGDGEVAVRAKTVHRRIDALCEAANTAGADYFDASTSMLIATQDLLTALGFPHRMAEPKEYGGSCEDCKWSAISGGGLCDGCAQVAEPKGLTEDQIKAIADKWADRWSTGIVWNVRHCIANALREAGALLSKGE